MLALAVWGVSAFDENNDNEEAQSKATELIAAFETAGIRAPSHQFVVDALGDDGGLVCDDPCGARSSRSTSRTYPRAGPKLVSARSS